MLQKSNPRTIARRLVAELPTILRTLPEMPMLVHDFLEAHNRLAREGSALLESNAMAASRHAGNRRVSPADRAIVDSRRLRWAIAGAALVVGASMLGAAHVVAAGGGLPIGVWIAGLAGGVCLFRAVGR